MRVSVIPGSTAPAYPYLSKEVGSNRVIYWTSHTSGIYLDDGKSVKGNALDLSFSEPIPKGHKVELQVPC